jgi:ATP-dependent Clp protease ATP-binding subunit ClpB
MNFEFTEKTEQTVAAAIQLAKDYANAQVHPVHFASVMLNEGAAQMPGAAVDPNAGHSSLFASVIAKAGGEPVRCIASLHSQVQSY